MYILVTELIYFLSLSLVFIMYQFENGIIENLLSISVFQKHGNSNDNMRLVLPMRKQRRRSSAPISAFVFATRIVQFLLYSNPKFCGCTDMSICVWPGRNFRRPDFSCRDSYNDLCHMVLAYSDFTKSFTSINKSLALIFGLILFFFTVPPDVSGCILIVSIPVSSILT